VVPPNSPAHKCAHYYNGARHGTTQLLATQEKSGRTRPIKVLRPPQQQQLFIRHKALVRNTVARCFPSRRVGERFTTTLPTQFLASRKKPGADGRGRNFRNGSLREVLGTLFREGKAILSPPHRPLEDLNNFPPPAYELIQPRFGQHHLQSRLPVFLQILPRFAQQVARIVGRQDDRRQGVLARAGCGWSDGNFFLGRALLIELSTPGSHKSRSAPNQDPINCSCGSRIKRP